MIFFQTLHACRVKITILNRIVSFVISALSIKEVPTMKSFKEHKVAPSRSHHFTSPSFWGNSFQNSKYWGMSSQDHQFESKNWLKQISPYTQHSGTNQGQDLS